MELGSLTGLSEVLSWSRDAELSVYLAHPESDVRTGLWHPGGTTGRLLLIGPEGGFSESEVALIRPYEVARLVWPGTILRTETAAIVFSGLLQAGGMNRDISNPDD
jgi:RsmE family RNA methyltransferase